MSSEFIRRGPWKLLAGLAIGGVGLLTPWLVGLSDALWWQLLPWLLLALLWVGAVSQLRRRRREAVLEGRVHSTSMRLPANEALHLNGLRASGRASGEDVSMAGCSCVDGRDPAAEAGS